MRIQVRVPYVTTEDGIARMARRLKGDAWVRSYLADFNEDEDPKDLIQIEQMPSDDNGLHARVLPNRGQAKTVEEYASNAVKHLESFLVMITPPGCHVETRLAQIETQQAEIEVLSDAWPDDGCILLFQGSPFERRVDKRDFQAVVEWAWDAAWVRRPWWGVALAMLESIREHCEHKVEAFGWEDFDDQPWQPEDWEDWDGTRRFTAHYLSELEPDDG